MQNTEKFGSYDRSIVVNPISSIELAYRLCFGYNTKTPLEAEQIVKEKLIAICSETFNQDQPLTKLIKEYLVKLDEKVHIMDFSYNFVLEEINSYVGVEFATGYALPLDFFMQKSLSDPYQKLVLGHTINSIADHFSYEKEPIDLFDMISEYLQGYDESELEEERFKERYQLEVRRMHAMRAFYPWCSNNFYVDNRYNNDPFVVLCKSILQELPNQKPFSYACTENYNSDDCIRIVKGDNMRDEERSNYENAILFLPSFANNSISEEQYTNHMTGAIMEAGEFCGCIVESQKADEVRAAFDWLRTKIELLFKYYDCKQLIDYQEWKQLSSLRHILSSMKMGTLRGVDLRTRKISTPLVRLMQ